MASKKPTPMMEVVQKVMWVQVSALHLDPLNPRRDPMNDEVEIRRVLCQDEGVLRLAAHIAKHGLNPLARLAIVDHPDLPGHYIVPEGNRRLCALQLLLDPERAPSPAAVKRFKELKASGVGIPDTIEVVWFKSRPLAAPWLSVNHEGEQDGIGTVQWGALEKARNNARGAHSATRPKNPNLQAMRLKEYAVGRGLITSDESQRISLTTLTRYLPNMRTVLALENSDDCTTRADRDQFDAAIQHFLRDAMTSDDPAYQPTVHSRANAPERNRYAARLYETGLAPRDRSQDPYDPARVAPPPAAVATSATPANRSAVHPDRRKYLIPSDFRVPFKDQVLQRMVSEGKQHTSCEDNRFGANYLIRAILERVVLRYARLRGIGTDRDLAAIIGAVLKHAQEHQVERPSRGISGVLGAYASDRGAKHGLQWLGNGVHGGRIPSANDNRATWDSVQPALQYLLDRAQK